MEKLKEINYTFSLRTSWIREVSLEMLSMISAVVASCESKNPTSCLRMASKYMYLILSTCLSLVLLQQYPSATTVMYIYALLYKPTFFFSFTFYRNIYISHYIFSGILHVLLYKENKWNFLRSTLCWKVFLFLFN